MPRAELRWIDCLLLAAVLMAAFHAIPLWVFSLLPARELYKRLGENGYGTLFDAVSLAMPLLLCMGSPRRCGLRLGHWRGHAWKVIGVCAVPVALAAIYVVAARMYDQAAAMPFRGDRIGVWLISPLAQDLLFTGFLYALFDDAFSGFVHRRCKVRIAVLVTALFFGLWHAPNYFYMSAGYVSFQLVYTMVGGAWVLLARQLTGSIVPGVLVHMVCNFLSWM